MVGWTQARPAGRAAHRLGWFHLPALPRPSESLKPDPPEPVRADPPVKIAKAPKPKKEPFWWDRRRIDSCQLLQHACGYRD